jgi:SAM-dependent methyltransferase
VHCTRCLREVRVERGILRLLDDSGLDGESAHELRLRDDMAQDADYAEGFRATWRLRQIDLAETSPTLEAMGPLEDKAILELGCGTGRYTTELAKANRMLLALDFSMTSLARLATKLEGCLTTGLVQADVTKLTVAPRQFDLVFSTLVSNLPTHAHREAMYRLVKEALKDDGQFVFSTHHHGVRQRLRGETADGRYSGGGIYRRLFTRREIDEEMAPYFEESTSRPIQVTIPLTWHLGLPLAKLSRVLEHVPLVNQLGNILLVTARRRKH